MFDGAVAELTSYLLKAAAFLLDINNVICGA